MELNKIDEYYYLYNKGAKSILLLLHGTGGDENDLIQISDLLDLDFHILSPRGNVSENGQNRFFARTSHGVFEESEIKQKASELVSFIKKAKEKHEIQNEKITVLGFSNGANIASVISFLYPETFSNLILLRPMLVLNPENIPDLSDKNVLILSGKNDEIISKENSEKLGELFKVASAKLTHQYLDSGHRLIEEDVKIIKSWINNLK